MEVCEAALLRGRQGLVHGVHADEDAAWTERVWGARDGLQSVHVECYRYASGGGRGGLPDETVPGCVRGGSGWEELGC